MAMITAMPSQIEKLHEMGALSARMVQAAQAHDWEQLVDLERSVSSLRNSLAGEDESLGSTDDRTLKAALIQRILDDDAEIRRHTEPWMEHVRQFLGDGARQRQVEKAYGASQF